MMRGWVWLAVGGAAFGVVTACSLVEVCTPGAQTACACPGGEQGIQLCKDDGSGVGACSCSSSSSSGGGGGGGGGGSGGGGGCSPGPCGGLTQWSKSFGDTGDDEVYALTADAQGNFAITGFIHGTVDFGGGPLSAGQTQAIFVAAFDAAGKHRWSKAFPGGIAALGRGIGADANGDVVLAANCDADVDFGGGPLLGPGDDLCLVKFDATGGHLWSKRFKSGGPTTLAVDPAGNILLGGQVMGDLGGGSITQRSSGRTRMPPRTGTAASIRSSPSMDRGASSWSATSATSSISARACSPRAA